MAGVVETMTMFLILILIGIGVMAAFITNVARANHQRAKEDTAQARRLKASTMYINGEE
jgi:uncharacterized alpha/beta hydrolase family protein